MDVASADLFRASLALANAYRISHDDHPSRPAPALHYDAHTSRTLLCFTTHPCTPHYPALLALLAILKLYPSTHAEFTGTRPCHGDYRSLPRQQVKRQARQRLPQCKSSLLTLTLHRRASCTVRALSGAWRLCLRRKLLTTLRCRHSRVIAHQHLTRRYASEVLLIAH